MPIRSIHVNLSDNYQKMLAALCKVYDFDKTAVVKLALFELAVKHGLASEFNRKKD